MSERSSYDPGTFSWADLMTSDADAAQEFYGGLFGWEFESTPLPDGGAYVMARKGGRDVAALSPSEQQPHWNNYVTVASAEDAAAKAQDLGGTIVAPAFDVMDAGRMAVVRDPTGAIFAAWEPRDHIGAALVNAPGALTWNDLTTPDVEAAERFYADLFGWRTEGMPDWDGYRVIRNGERTNGGMRPDTSTEPGWIPYFGADDVDQAVAYVRDRRGAVYFGPTDVPQGRIAVVGDPQGAVFAMWSGEYDD